MEDKTSTLFTKFKADISSISLPDKFTFPFYYGPHPLSVIASQELQEHLTSQQKWKHNFGNPIATEKIDQKVPIGKMFGVLVVKNKNNELGYLSAFSGKIADKNHHPKFVPPVYDMLIEGNFFIEGGKEIIAINKTLEILEQEKEYITALNLFKKEKELHDVKLIEKKQQINSFKKARKKIRERAKKEISDENYNVLHEDQKEESLKQQYFYRKESQELKDELQIVQDALNVYLDKITLLKLQRKELSNTLQNRLFNEYKFLNAKAETKNLLNIFESTVLKKPPAGAGECAAPKLLQYAFLHDLTPITLAEFWWGQSPSGDIKKHKHYYPACRGKCEPILHHMLQGIKVDPNPMLGNPGLGKKIQILFEDEHFVIINKPAELLSVPGKNIIDSVHERMKAKYPKADGPLIVHRLDMSTSGIMVIALTKKSYDYIQKQFINRSIKKRYIAQLDGVPATKEGIIELPLRVDLNDRPRQIVCYEHGKASKTRWKLLKVLNEKATVQFYPVTGRTHQLRMHAAHFKGLNIPITGDDLYGTKSSRLHLHAEYIEFTHPESMKVVKFKCDADF